MSESFWADAEWTELGINGWGLYQRRHGLRYSLDSVLLAHFAAPQPGDRVYDLGSGMGIVAMLMAAREAQGHYLGLELQPQLVAMARASARRNGISPERLAFQESDLRTPEAALANGATLITANPPFFRPGHGAESEARERALARHELTIDLATLCRTAAYYLRQRGRFVIIHRAGRLTDVLLACREANLNPTRLWLIYARSGEASNLIVVECCYLGRQELVIEAPFVLRDRDTPCPPALRAWYEGAVT